MNRTPHLDCNTFLERPPVRGLSCMFQRRLMNQTNKTIRAPSGTLPLRRLNLKRKTAILTFDQVGHESRQFWVPVFERTRMGLAAERGPCKRKGPICRKEGESGNRLSSFCSTSVCVCVCVFACVSVFISVYLCIDLSSPATNYYVTGRVFSLTHLPCPGCIRLIRGCLKYLAVSDLQFTSDCGGRPVSGWPPGSDRDPFPLPMHGAVSDSTLV